MEQNSLTLSPRNLHPVEELFELQANMRALRQREAELRVYFLQDADAQDRAGPYHQVEIHQKHHRTLVKSRLPQAILEDTRYFRETTSPTMRVVRANDVAPATLEGEWHRIPEDEFEVIDLFDA